MKNSSLELRNVCIFGRRTSMRLEPQMWAALKDIALREDCTIHHLVSLTSLVVKPPTKITAGVRVMIMLYYRAACHAGGHDAAGHGNFERMIRRCGVGKERWLQAGGDKLPRRMYQ